MTTKQTPSEETPVTETPREAKLSEVYNPNEITLADSGLAVQIHGIKFKAYVAFAAPIVGRIMAVVHDVDSQRKKQPELSEGEVQSLIFQGLGHAMAASPDTVVRLLANMCTLSVEQIENLSPGDGSQLLEACAERIRLDDTRRFFQGTTRLSGVSMSGTG